MRILIGCEFSGIVRDEFIRLGHDAVSCDILPTERPGPHIQDDILTLLNDGWDMMIAFPPCTYLCSSGLHWNTRREGRAEKTKDAIEFVSTLMQAPIQKIAIENPVGCISTQIRRPEQIIQPWEFGEDASKKTCLWLKNLPLLKPTKFIPPSHGNGLRPVWGNQTASGQNKLAPSANRAKERSKTYKGVAAAMANQWGAGMNTTSTDTAVCHDSADSAGGDCVVAPRNLTELRIMDKFMQGVEIGNIARMLGIPLPDVHKCLQTHATGKEWADMLATKRGDV